MAKDLYMDKELTSAWHRDADQWQLDRDRNAVIERLQAINPSELHGSHESLSTICKVVYQPMTGWTVGACESLRNCLIALMGGEVVNSDTETNAEFTKNGENYQLATYDALGNERHKAVCELQKLDGCSPLAHDFRNALAAAVNVPRDGAPYSDKELCHLICDRLIHLLGDGHSRTCPKCDDDVSESDQPSSITDELRRFAQRYKHEWLNVKDGTVTFTTAYCAPDIDSVNMRDYICSIADRIDAQYAELRAELEEAQALIADNANDWTAYRIAQRERDEPQDRLQAIRDVIDGTQQDDG